MRNISKSVRDFLISKSAITATAKQVFLNWFPNTVKESVFPFIVIITEGKPDAEGNITSAQIETRVYVQTQKADMVACNLDGLIVDVMTGAGQDLKAYSHDIGIHGFEWVDCVNKGQYQEDPDLKWVYYLSTYVAEMVNQ